MPYRTIQNIESGRSSINLRTIYKISKKLKIHPRELFNLEKVMIQSAQKRTHKKSLYKNKKEN
ncbi:DNA-binding protein [Leptospira interrogans serovar Bratislava]|nr:DNA-binding protein [Leptospira interrogans serovar Bratislava]